MPDHGVNAVEAGTSAVDTALTARLAARFERALAADEEGRPRDVPADVRARRSGGGLFDAAMATHARATTFVRARDAAATAAAHPATLRAVARAARARAHEILAAAGAGASRVGAASVLDDPGLAAAESAPAMLAIAVELCTRNAELDGTAATLRRFAVDVRAPGASALAARLAKVAMGVLVLTPDADGSATRAAPPVGERIARARRALAVRATRAEEIERAAAEARTAMLAAIEHERVARRDAAERALRQLRDELQRRHADERPQVEAQARARHAEALERTRASRQRSEDNAQHDRLARHATLRDEALRAIDEASEAYEREIAGRFDEVEATHARWEAAVAALDVLEDAALRQQLLADGFARHTAAVAAARAEAERIEREARAERDRRIAVGEAREQAETRAIEAAYEAARERAARANVRAVQIADDALRAAIATFDAEAARALERVASDAAAAIAEADAHAARRIVLDVPAAADAARRERDAAIAALLDELGDGDAR